MTVTITDVALAAGVGESTVSRVLRNEGSFSRRSREKVLSAAAELGYVPNRLAGSLVSAESRLVAVVVPSLANIVFADVLRGAGEVLDEADHRGVFGVTDYDPGKEERLVASFLEYRPAAVLLAGLEHTERTMRMLSAAGCRVVEMLDVDGPGVDVVVGFSNERAGRAAARHLISRGYANVGYVGHDLDVDRRAAKRLDGFEAELAGEGLRIADREVVAEGSSVSLGKRALAALLARRPDLDAVYFSNDDVAMGGCFHCLQEGIGVPDRLGLFGHNGLDLAQEMPRPLSTIRTPRVAVGRAAARLALEGAASQVVDLGFTLVEGGTTRRTR